MEGVIRKMRYDTAKTMTAYYHEYEPKPGILEISFDIGSTVYYEDFNSVPYDTGDIGIKDTKLAVAYGI